MLQKPSTVSLLASIPLQGQKTSQLEQQHPFKVLRVTIMLSLETVAAMKRGTSRYSYVQNYSTVITSEPDEILVTVEP